jgi:hypothetical protein
MGGGGKGSKRQVYDFLASLDFGICHGPLDHVNAITVKDKDIYVGPVKTSQSAVINLPEAFGGDDAEGGVVGALDIHLGTADQLMSGEQAARSTRVPSDKPGYRGIAHVFFRGEKTVSDLSFAVLNAITTAMDKGFGFRWTSNNPYLPSTRIHATRSPVGLTGAALIPATKGVENGTFTPAVEADWVDVDGNLQRQMLPDANPAHILYELMTNAVWGRGESPSVMNEMSYLSAAETLRVESFGLSLQLVEQDKIETYIQEILDHIRAVQFQNPRTGEWNLRLIRDDYSDGAQIGLGPDNCELVTLKERTWGEVINQIRVTYTDPISGESESVTADNPSVIAIQGEVVSETRDYYGVRNKYLASWIARRDVIEASQLISSVRLKVNRQGFDLTPGMIAPFTWPDEDIDSMVLRINDVDWGSSTERDIVIDCTEDIYANTTFDYAETQEPEDQIVSDTAVALDTYLFTDTPLPFLTTNGITVAQVNLAAPQTGVLILANDNERSVVNIQAESETVQPNGSTAQGPVAQFSATRNSTLGVDLAAEALSTVPAGLVEGVLRTEGIAGDLFMVGEDSTLHEIVMLDTFDGVAGTWSVIRGVWDTVPRAWLSAARIWVMPKTLANTDSRETFTGDTEVYRLLPRTSAGRLPRASAPDISYTIQGRPHAPFRPADVEIEGNGFGDTQYLAGTAPVTFTVTWANRNRTAEDAVAARWLDGNVTPEAGQTTTIRFLDSDTGVMEHEYTGLTGTSFVCTAADIVAYRFYDVVFIAVRDGIESFQSAARSLEIERVGYGNNIGYDYGENDGG